jgi:hypothetical protein
MAQFVTFDDGMSYINVDRVESFTSERDKAGNMYTVFRMKDGQLLRTSKSISDVADRFNCVNLWH